MDSLKIQDVFEPYYAGRERPATTKNGKPAGGLDRPAKAPPRRPFAKTRPSATKSLAEAGKSTEH